MASYLTVEEFKARTIMPQADVDALEVGEPGFLDAQLASWSSRLNAQLAKRYATPFTAPVPEVVLEWLTRCVTPRAYLKRGVNPSDAQFDAVMKDAETVLVEVKETADAVEGLYDLPLREDLTSSGISKGAPLSYSEASPYVWTTNQATTGRTEDGNG